MTCAGTGTAVRPAARAGRPVHAPFAGPLPLASAHAHFARFARGAAAPSRLRV